MTPRRALQAYSLKEPVILKLRDCEINGTIINIGFKPQTKFMPGESKKNRHRVVCTVLDNNKNSVCVCLAEDLSETREAPAEPYGSDIINYFLKCFQT